jgi:hypothetical protein
MNVKDNFHSLDPRQFTWICHSGEVFDFVLISFDLALHPLILDAFASMEVG